MRELRTFFPPQRVDKVVEVWYTKPMTVSSRPEYVVESELGAILEKLRKYHRDMTPGFWSLKPTQTPQRDVVAGLHCDDILTSPRQEDLEGIAWIRNNLGGILRRLEQIKPTL